MFTLPGYKVLNCLYEGTTSTIYRALRLSNELHVVVKVSTQKALTEKTAQRFQREFDIGQQIHSSHVVRYLESKQDPTYGIALIMEDDESAELTSFISAQGFSNEAFLKIAIQIIQGLQAIHAANIVHNDLKPSNIIIQPSTQHIKIIDFNRASSLRQEIQPAISTHLGVGTLAYISPEQTGRINRTVDYRTDFYSLGITFYQLLCGQLPFTSTDTLGLIHQHLAKQPTPPHQIKPTIPLPLSQMVMKLLEKEAEKRYQSCEGILHDLTMCLTALHETGMIPEFALGQEDFSPKFTLFQHLYGRENEINSLMSAFDRVSQGSREVVMVSGQPGVGKSMLIQELQKPITLKNGYFISGKFDQLNKNVAYSALTQAFDSLIKQLLTEDEANINQWRNQLRLVLSSQVQLIIQVVPTLSLLIGPQPSAQIANLNQAKTVFNFLFLEFIQVLANAAHPLVLFLDDLQWADNASLELMAYLLQQPQIKHMLWISAYRDNEVTDLHPTLRTINTLRETQVKIQTLTLSSLHPENLQRWISDSLHMPIADIIPLSELIQQKTSGNPFFVKLFLQTLYDQQLLTFSLKNHWEWNLTKIRSYPATENVITLMTYQIQQLPAITQEILSVASCLGHRVTLNALQVASAISIETIDEGLQPALHSNILIQTDSEMHFAHDKVQEAAYHLLTETERTRTHLMLGKRLLTHFSTEGNELFDIVMQFNHCYALITEFEERLQLVRLNLKAGQKSKQATAYAMALNYLHAAKDWLDIKNLWKVDYTLAFTIAKELIEVEYLSGHFEISETLVKEIQPHLQSILDKVESFRLLIIQKTIQGQHQEAIMFGHCALQLLGSGLPLDNLNEFIETTAFDLKQKLHSRDISSLLDMPLAVEPEKQAIFKILASIYGACYQTGAELLIATTMMAVNLSLTAGHALESCHSYASYGLLLCSKFQEYALGYQFGSLALQLAEKFQSPAQHCKSSIAMLGCIYPWSKSIQQLPALLTTTYEECLACGEPEFAGYSAIHKIQMLFYQGTPLTKVQQEALPLMQFAQSTKNQITINIIQAIQKLLVNLIGNTTDESFDISTITTDQIKFEEHCLQTKSFNALCLYYIHRAFVLYLYGYYKQAFSDLISAEKYLSFIRGNYANANFNWYDSLIRLALYATASNEEQLMHLQQVTQNQHLMELWQANCSANFAHKYRLVAAEFARIKGNYEQAEALYDQAIKLASQHGFIQEQALIAELATQYWLARNKPLCAQGYLNIAFNNYKQWGAKHKLALLKTQYFDVLQPFAPPGLSPLDINQETTLSSNTLKFLDLSSILKASHTISSEIELPKLLRNIMQLIIENAGAQRGAVLFIEPDDSVFIQAEYHQDGKITTLQKIPLADWTQGALTVINYVKRLHQQIVIDNATTHELFMNDPYIFRIQAKSILCIPILKYSELKAILYAENNLISHAFTPERVQTLLILTAQMAISLENARYFAEQLKLTRQLAEQSIRAKIAEESLQAVTHDYKLSLEASKAGTWNWQIGTDNVTWDAANYALFGLMPGEFKGTYNAVIERIHPDDRAPLEQDVKRCIERDIPHDMEYRVIWPDGSQHVIAGKGRVYRDKENQPLKMAGVCIDVTQRKQLEEERLQALKQAEEKERRRAEEAEKYRKDLEDFIAMVCHEIRNPMSGIYGNVDFLQEIKTFLRHLLDKLPLDIRTLLNETLNKLEGIIKDITQCIKHQKAIIDDVLDLSKLEAGKMEFANQPFRLKTVIEDVTHMYAAPLAQKKLLLRLSLPEADPWIKGDAHRLKMVLINLMGNALKYTEQGEIKITLQFIQASPTQTTFTLSVADTGIGMTAEEQSHLFQRFARVAAAEYEGSGLGLLLSKRFIERMGGQIDVTSEKGKGSQFTLQLTCETAPAEINAVPLTAQAAPPPTIPPATQHILIVEDNALNQRLLRRQLEAAGYGCEVANNGQEAIDKWATGSFDFIFMDLEMPVMNGFDATTAIRERERQSNITRKIPIVALSAYASKEFVQQAHNVGMDDYITKPHEKSKLLEAIQKWTLAQPSPAAPSADTALALNLVQHLLTLQTAAATSTEQTNLTKSSPSFWRDPQPTPTKPTESLELARTWMPAARRNSLYPILDSLSNALTSLKVSIIKPEAKYQAKASHTGWQLFCLKGTEECLAVLNIEQETQVDHLLKIIQRTDTTLQAKKMRSGSTHSLAINFTQDNALITSINALISNIQAQRILPPISH